MNDMTASHCSGHRKFEYDCIDCSDALERKRKSAAPGDGTPRPWETAQRHYRGFDIKVKRDFGGMPHWIDGMPCMWGYVVCHGSAQEYAGCNAMPGATWFQTVKEAKRAIDVFIEANGDADAFWARFRDPDMPTHVETASMPDLAGTMPGMDKAENRVEFPVLDLDSVAKALSPARKRVAAITAWHDLMGLGVETQIGATYTLVGCWGTFDFVGRWTPSPLRDSPSAVDQAWHNAEAYPALAPRFHHWLSRQNDMGPDQAGGPDRT